MTDPTTVRPATCVIEDVISDLLVAEDIEELFALVDRHDLADTAAPDNSYGLIRALPRGTLSYNDDMEWFVCRIGGQIMTGMFAGSSKLPAGKKVKAVVEKHGEVLVARAIVSEEAGLAWLMQARGGSAKRKANFVAAWWWFCFAMLFVIPSALLLEFSGIGRLEALGWGVGATAALCLGFAVWNSITLNEWADEATEFLRALGFAEPEHVDLIRYQYSCVHSHEVVQGRESHANHANVYCYRRAIEDGKLKLAQ